MNYEKNVENWKEKVIEASNNSNSATHAASLLGIKYDTYRKYAVKYGCFKTNQPGKGISKLKDSRKIPLIEILKGNHPQYQSNKLRIRLLDEGILERKCNNCQNITWLDNPIPLELNHIDGNNSNHSLDNLEVLCPNCHALTSTYRGKNTRKCRDFTVTP